MTDKQQPEALATAAEYRSTMGVEVLHSWAVDACAAQRRQHAELETLTLYKNLADEYGLSIFKDLKDLTTEIENLREKLKTYEDLGGAADDVQLLRMGYAAARLEVESLKAQLAERASHGQAPAQAVPAAVAGPSGYGPNVTVRRSCSDCKACNSESYAVQGDSGHYVYCEHPSLPESKYIGDTNWNTPHWCPVSAPTTQPAPQQEAQEPCPSCRNSDIYACTCTFPKSRNTAPQPSPAAQGDVPESEYRRGYRHGYEQRDAEVRGALV